MSTSATVMHWSSLSSCFAPRATQLIGAEIEFVPVDAVTRRPVSIASSLRIARRASMRMGLDEYGGPYCIPNFSDENLGAITFEPGGQIEYSAPPYASVSLLAARLRETEAVLRESASDEGVDLLALGIDPCNPVESTTLQIGGKRYPAMDAYFRTIGPFGARMMRQTASFQVSLDTTEDPVTLWRVLNAAAPVVVSLFANSAIYEGRPTGHRSFRAHVWRMLDPLRTGLLPGGNDPAAEYLAFALGAPAMMHPDADGAYRPFGELLAQGLVDEHDWATHLTTLFPEVRARGTFEVRSADAVPPEHYVVPLALLGGIAYDPAARADALDLLGPPDPARLACASRDHASRDLLDIALAGCRRLGPQFLDPADAEVVAGFRPG
jgi:glutamate--cysteine ligase